MPLINEDNIFSVRHTPPKQI